jgi:hypothetical protein
LELNVHVHALGFDGVFAAGGRRDAAFHRLPGPTDTDVAWLVKRARRRALAATFPA